MISSRRSHSYKKFMIQLDFDDEQRKISYRNPLPNIVTKFNIKNLKFCLLFK